MIEAEGTVGAEASRGDPDTTEEMREGQCSCSRISKKAREVGRAGPESHQSAQLWDFLGAIDGSREDVSQS